MNKTYISLACKKSPFFPPVKTVLRHNCPRRKSPLNCSPNTRGNRTELYEELSLTGKNKRNEKPKRNKK